MLRNPSHLVYIVLSPMFSTIFGIINIITVYIFCRKFRLSTLSLIVMVNICICDIFVCLVSNTFYLVNLVHPVYDWWTGVVACKMFKFLSMLTNIAQIYFLCILNADRLRRLLYCTSKQWQKRHGIILVAMGWIASTTICLPRLALFDVELIQNVSPLHNATIVDIACKPAGLNHASHVVVTVITFFVAFAIPACHIIYTLGRSQIYMWQRRKQIHFSTTSNMVTKMNSKLALTFNLTGALFILIWTPFFVLSLIDLSTDLLTRDQNIEFSLRCTLLILGSTKPVIYAICLDKFRDCFLFNRSMNAFKTVHSGAVKRSEEAQASGSTKVINISNVMCDTVV